MSQFVYKCVSVPESIGIGKNQSHDQVVEAYANIINTAAQDGWEYHGIDVVESDYSANFLIVFLCKIPVIGALIRMFFRCDEAVRFKVLVFKKQQ